MVAKHSRSSDLSIIFSGLILSSKPAVRNLGGTSSSLLDGLWCEECGSLLLTKLGPNPSWNQFRDRWLQSTLWVIRLQYVDVLLFLSEPSKRNVAALQSCLSSGTLRFV